MNLYSLLATITIILISGAAGAQKANDTLRMSVKVIPLGMAMGVGVMGLIFIHHEWMALVMLSVLGTLAGMFVVPMNALLQHRGHVLMGTGHSIAIQNFNENLSILVMTGMYSALLWAGLSINIIVILFGGFVLALMWLIKKRHETNQLINDDVCLLDDKGQH